jgi:hypothetical protein
MSTCHIDIINLRANGMRVMKTIIELDGSLRARRMSKNSSPQNVRRFYRHNDNREWTQVTIAFPYNPCTDEKGEYLVPVSLLPVIRKTKDVKSAEKYSKRKFCTMLKTKWCKITYHIRYRYRAPSFQYNSQRSY